MNIKVSYDQIIEKIKKEKDISDIEIQEKINRKLKDLSGLISKEGAAHIVANELGIKLFDQLGKGTIKIKDLLVGMRRTGIVAKVTNVFNVNEFKKNNKEAKVGSFIVGDESGRVRVVLWDDKHIKDMELGNIKEGAVVKIENAYVRENNNFKELHLNGNSIMVVNPTGVSVDKVAESKGSIAMNKMIKDLEVNQNNVNLTGTIVQLFEPRFFNICSECGKKVFVEGDKNKCKEHGEVNIKIVPVLNMFFDDGTDNIRVVSFRHIASKILDMDEENVVELKDPTKFEEMKDKILGKQLVLTGRVVKNDMFDRLEFIVNGAVQSEPDKLINDLK